MNDLPSEGLLSEDGKVLQRLLVMLRDDPAKADMYAALIKLMYRVEPLARDWAAYTRSYGKITPEMIGLTSPLTPAPDDNVLLIKEIPGTGLGFEMHLDATKPVQFQLVSTILRQFYDLPASS